MTYNTMSPNNQVIVKVLPRNSEIKPIPRMPFLTDKFYKEYDNSEDMNIRTLWRGALDKYYPKWVDNIKKTNKILYLIKPEVFAYTSMWFFEPLIGNPNYYGYIGEMSQLVVASIPYDSFKKIFEIHLNTGQRAFEPEELRNLDIL